MGLLQPTTNETITDPLRAMADALVPILYWGTRDKNAVVTFEDDGSAYRDPSNLYMNAVSKPSMFQGMVYRAVQLRSGRLGTMRDELTANKETL